MKLNLKKMNRMIHLYLYRKGNGIVPTSASVYGSADMRFYAKRYKSLEAYFDIKRSEIIAIDKPEQRCNASNAGQSLSICVGSFIERNLNCSLKMFMSNSMHETCNISSMDFEDLKHLVEPITIAEEREIFEMTGCMPSCSRSKFKLTSTKFHDELDPTENDKGDRTFVATISLKMPHGEYELLEEYYLYRMESLIPDVGGYLGLLLGYSLLGMYHKAKKWLKDLKLMEFFKWLGLEVLERLRFLVSLPLAGTAQKGRGGIRVANKHFLPPHPVRYVPKNHFSNSLRRGPE